MNGKLSLIDDSQSSADKNASNQIDNSKDVFIADQNDNNKELSNSKDIEGSITADTPKEEEIIDAPSDGARASSLVERLKRSLGVPADEVSYKHSH